MTSATNMLAVLPQVLSLIAEASKLVPAAGAVPRYLEIAAGIVGEGVNAYDKLTGLQALVADMVNQQREPTTEEWASLETRSDVAHAAIQAVNLSSEDA